MKPLHIILAVSALYFIIKGIKPGVTLWQAPVLALPYTNLIRNTERDYNLPNNLLMRLLYQESRFRGDIIDGRVLSRTGAQGIAQVMPETALSPGFNTPPLNDPFNPKESIQWAGAYLAGLYKHSGDWRKTLAAYNAGMGTVNRAAQKEPVYWLSIMPMETRNYVNEITRDVSV